MVVLMMTGYRFLHACVFGCPMSIGAIENAGWAGKTTGPGEKPYGRGFSPGPAVFVRHFPVLYFLSRLTGPPL